MKINNFRCLSLFDGISACQQALKNLGIECEYYASEVDKYAIQITQKNFPNTIQLGDVKNIHYCSIGKILYSESNKYCDETDSNYKDCYPETESIDLLVGGSPCQDLSIAKKGRKGLDGERSGLFYEYVRILKEVKPKFFILENVNSMSKESKQQMQKALFDIEPIMINSSLLTAQQRKRIYFVGKLQEDGTYKKVAIEQPQDKGILLKDILEIPLNEEEFVGNLFNKRIFTKKVGTLGTGSGRTNKQGMCVFKDDWRFIRKLTPIEYEILQGFPIRYTEDISNTQRYKALGNSFTVPVIEHILKTILYETKQIL